MRGAVEQYGGRVEKFIGDAVVGVFGVPQVREDDALRAVRAASEMRSRLAELNGSLNAEWGVELEARIGLCTGGVVVGSDDEVVLGDVMNTAARLEQVAMPGEILIGDQTHRLVGHAITAEPVADLELKGKHSAAAAWRVVSIDPTAEAVVREFDRPLVGREYELGLLRQMFERTVAERRSGLATVLGFPGIGKSRLALGLAESLAGEARVLVGHCRSYGEGITYWPIAEMVREAVGENVQAGLVALLDGEPDGERIASVIVAALGEGELTGGGEETFWALRRLFEALAAERPLVLVFEDIHWAEPTLLDLIEYLAERVRERPLIVLCLARPELLEARPGWGGGKINAVSLLLESLSDSDAQRMLEERLEGRVIAPDVRARIVESAQGVPLFLEQMLAMLVEQESISADDVPPAISALLAARLESLDYPERRLLERAAVEGVRFHAGALVALAGDDRDDVLRRLDGLASRELVRVDEADLAADRSFRFAHALIRDAAYERVPKAARAALHEHLAEWLEDHGSGDELVGYHLERAFRLAGELAPPDERARALARRASQRLATGAGVPTTEVTTRRGQASSSGPVACCRLTIPNGLRCSPSWAWFSARSISAALPLLTEAIEQSRIAGNARVEWQSTVIRSRVLLYADPTARPPTDLLAEAERATEQLELLGDEWGVASALILRADAHLMLGQLSHSHDLCLRAATLGKGPIRTRALALASYGLCQGDLAARDAETSCLELLEAAGESRRAEAVIRSNLGWAQALQGRVDEGYDATRSARDALNELGVAAWLGSATLACGHVELLRGDAAAAEREFARAQETFVTLDDNWSLSGAVVDRALALCELGRYAEALAVCAHPQAPYEPEWVIDWNRVHALANSAQGSLDSALAHTETAVQAAEPTEYLNHRAAVLADRATILDMLDRPADALADLEVALTLYQRKGNVVKADRISERLAQRG